MLYLATRPLEYAGRGIRWTARKVGRVFSAGYQRLQKAKEHVARTRKQT
jgi:hypothetical protein